MGRINYYEHIPGCLHANEYSLGDITTFSLTTKKNNLLSGYDAHAIYVTFDKMTKLNTPEGKGF